MIRALLAAAASTSSIALFGATRRESESVSRPALAGGERRAMSIPKMTVGIGGIAAIAGLAAGGPPAALVAGAIGASVPHVLERRRRSRRTVRIEEQLLDAVTTMAASMRAGSSLVQAIGRAAEVGPPLGSLLGQAVDRIALGSPVDESLHALAEAIGGADARLVTGVLRLHRRVGGAMASSLDDLVRTLRARRDGVRELRSLTAQARLSAAILGLLPIGFFLFLSVVARRDVAIAYHSTVGASAIAVGLLLQGGAFLWIRGLLRVEGA
jgi:tight adherence protein B